MATADPRSELSIADLVREAIGEAESLLRTEIELAKNEVRREIKEAKSASILVGIAGVVAILGLGLLLVALVGMITPKPLGLLVGGIVLLAVAGTSALAGYKLFPKKPLFETKRELERDVTMLKEKLS